MFHTIYHTFLLQQNLFFKTQKWNWQRSKEKCQKHIKSTCYAHAVKQVPIRLS